MDLLTGKIRPIYFKYLSAAFGSAMITSVYSIVDMAMVGQYQGPDGTAALAVVAPIWNIIYSLGLLMGIGGSVIFSTLRGQTERKGKVENEYFVLLRGILIIVIQQCIQIDFKWFKFVPDTHYQLPEGNVRDIAFRLLMFSILPTVDRNTNQLVK